MHLVFDIGGTYMRLCAAENNVLTNEPVKLATPKDYSAAIKQFSDMASQIANGGSYAGCAGGVPGVLNSDSSLLINAQNLPDWTNKPLKQDLENILKCPVTLANDTVIGALGEANAGSGQGHRIMAYLAIGTGVGGCRVVEKAIDASAQGFEPGAQIISQAGRQAWTLEDFVSGTAIANKYGIAVGSPVADKSVIDELAWNLAIGIHNLTVIWSPDVIVLGGGVINNDVIPLDQVNTYIVQLMEKFPVAPPVIASQLKDKAGLHGAVILLGS